MTDKTLKTVSVMFNGSAMKTYDYYTKQDVKVGDTVVVDSPMNGYACAKVHAVEEGLTSKVTKPIVSVVDDTGYQDELKAQEKRAKIIRELALIDKKTSDRQRYSHLGAIDDRAKALLGELDKLDS